MVIVRYGMVEYDMVQYDMVQYGIVVWYHGMVRGEVWWHDGSGEVWWLTWFWYGMV